MAAQATAAARERGGWMKISAQFMPGDLPVFAESVRKAEEAATRARGSSTDSSSGGTSSST